MFLFYVLCARRRSEVVNLRGGDLRVEGKKAACRVRLMGGWVKWKELPPPAVWEAIRHYLELSARALSDVSPVFVATVDNDEYLRDDYGTPKAEGQEPPTGTAVSKALKHCAARTGVDPGSISLRSLRHLAAELFQQASGDVRPARLFPDHAHLYTTQIYLGQLTGEEHRHWQVMANRLGL